MTKLELLNGAVHNKGLSIGRNIAARSTSRHDTSIGAIAGRVEDDVIRVTRILTGNVNSGSDVRSAVGIQGLACHRIAGGGTGGGRDGWLGRGAVGGSLSVDEPGEDVAGLTLCERCGGGEAEDGGGGDDEFCSVHGGGVD